jgi:acetoin utilization protein AcuB
MQVTNCMTRNPVCVTSNDTLARARELMDSGHFRRLPVIDNGRLVGMVSEGDLRQHWGYYESTKVNVAMTPDPVVIGAEATAEDAARLMLQRKIGGLPVMENGRLVGIVSTSDLLKALLSILGATEKVVQKE